jgi:toluene monooxygenase system protein E
VDLLAAVLTPSRYLSHGLQMLTAYVQQLAPSSYIANCATFQTADQLRRVQLAAYRAKQLSETYPDRHFGTAERAQWEQAPGWQPVRELVERLLIAYDWHDAFVGTQLVLKPVTDLLTLREFARVARAQGSDLDALIADNLYNDAARSQRWTAACTRFLISAGDGNRAALLETLAPWRPLGEAAIVGGAELLAPYAGTDDIAGHVRQGWAGLLTEAGLGPDA